VTMSGVPHSWRGFDIRDPPESKRATRMENPNSTSRLLKDSPSVIPEATRSHLAACGCPESITTVLKMRETGSMDSGLRPFGRPRNDNREFFNILLGLIDAQTEVRYRAFSGFDFLSSSLSACDPSRQTLSLMCHEGAPHLEISAGVINLSIVTSTYAELIPSDVRRKLRR